MLVCSNAVNKSHCHSRVTLQSQIDRHIARSVIVQSGLDLWIVITTSTFRCFVCLRGESRNKFTIESVSSFNRRPSKPTRYVDLFVPPTQTFFNGHSFAIHMLATIQQFSHERLYPLRCPPIAIASSCTKRESVSLYSDYTSTLKLVSHNCDRL